MDKFHNWIMVSPESFHVMAPKGQEASGVGGSQSLEEAYVLPVPPISNSTLMPGCLPAELIFRNNTVIYLILNHLFAGGD